MCIYKSQSKQTAFICGHEVMLFFFHRSLTWEQYLKDQAIYIIATRPNISVLPIQKVEWFSKMRNNLSGSELRESGLNELTADQSDTKSDTSGLSSASIERLHICSGVK